LAQESEMLQSLDRAFELMITLLSISGAALLSYLLWLTKPATERVIGTRFIASIAIPLLICILIWFWRPFIYSKTKKLFCCLIAFSMLGNILFYYATLFTIIVLLDLIASFPQVAVIILLIVVYSIPSFFPYRRIMNQYRTLTLNLDFWQKGRLYSMLPFLTGAILADVPILLALIL